MLPLPSLCLLRCSQPIGCMSFRISSLISSSKVSINQQTENPSSWLAGVRSLFSLTNKPNQNKQTWIDHIWNVIKSFISTHPYQTHLYQTGDESEQRESAQSVSLQLQQFPISVDVFFVTCRAATIFTVFWFIDQTINWLIEKIFGWWIRCSLIYRWSSREYIWTFVWTRVNDVWTTSERQVNDGKMFSSWGQQRLLLFWIWLIHRQ